MNTKNNPSDQIIHEELGLIEDKNLLVENQIDFLRYEMNTMLDYLGNNYLSRYECKELITSEKPLKSEIVKKVIENTNLQLDPEDFKNLRTYFRYEFNLRMRSMKLNVIENIIQEISYQIDNIEIPEDDREFQSYMNQLENLTKWITSEFESFYTLTEELIPMKNRSPRFVTIKELREE
ncbi:MAG: hypothetical protein ACON4O_07475 [Lentimonas sp.]